MPLVELELSEDDLLRQVMKDKLGDPNIGWLRTADVAKLENTTMGNVRKLRSVSSGPVVKGWRHVQGVGLRIHARTWLKCWIERGASIEDILPLKTAA